MCHERRLQGQNPLGRSPAQDLLPWTPKTLRNSECSSCNCRIRPCGWNSMDAYFGVSFWISRPRIRSIHALGSCSRPEQVHIGESMRDIPHLRYRNSAWSKESLLTRQAPRFDGASLCAHVLGKTTVWRADIGASLKQVNFKHPLVSNLLYFIN